jgi:hypothetical protein
MGNLQLHDRPDRGRGHNIALGALAIEESGVLDSLVDRGQAQADMPGQPVHPGHRLDPAADRVVELFVAVS